MSKENKKTYIYGKHAIYEACLVCPHAVRKIFLATDDEEITQMAKEKGIALGQFSKKQTKREIPDYAAHQGYLAEINAKVLVRTYNDFVENLKPTKDTALALLGEVQFEQNVGAIIRSAAAFGLAGVLIPEHNQAQISGEIIKVSSGMAFRIPIVTIANVNETIRDLKKRGFWIYGSEAGSPKNLTDEVFDAPSVFVLGNEGKGMREKTKEQCDVLLRIPMHARCESLNVAASAAVIFYEWSRGHKQALLAGK